MLPQVTGRSRTTAQDARMSSTEAALMPAF
jgi:hypothetical protein